MTRDSGTPAPAFVQGIEKQGATCFSDVTAIPRMCREDVTPKELNDWGEKGLKKVAPSSVVSE